MTRLAATIAGSRSRHDRGNRPRCRPRCHCRHRHQVSRGTSAAGEPVRARAQGRNEMALAMAALVLGVLQFLCFPIVGTIPGDRLGKIGMNRARRGEASNGGWRPPALPLGSSGLYSPSSVGSLGQSSGECRHDQPPVTRVRARRMPGQSWRATDGGRWSNCNLAGAGSTWIGSHSRVSERRQSQSGQPGPGSDDQPPSRCRT